MKKGALPILLGTSVLMNLILAFGILAILNNRSSPGAIVYQSVLVHDGMEDLQTFQQKHKRSALHDAAAKFLTVSGEYQQYSSERNDLSFRDGLY
ncbi:hypothetical protein JI721_00250 [Alicyclobacillus cycloheptanicus]|uniref:Uncharacterized protein n=1 Tax=Alicyclobacillus cycloheptanicus TaxID=1457 RepID=A0ABT9XJN8_9BACL|nr:hypothetical protein [Alicyclobacillus cycloheptanicus]MDQ0190525.1 hypothetical protein [Alicyclobacillus cycloheptanicus]WDM01369.1 hypothetical protein JI721_00250 [Alicyclobacillus cycloheptanicus]